MHGLTRVRGMTQDDSHSYVTPEQAPAEIKHLLDFVPRACSSDFGLDDFYLELSTRDDSKPDKFVGSDEEWADGHRGARGGRAPSPASSWCPTRAARRTTGRRSRCRPATRSAAPGRCRPSSTTSTSRAGFGLEYQAADGTRQQPVMIHSAKFGSIERFIGVLVEHYAGAFPPWLAPVQVQAIPIAERHNDYLHEVAARLRARGIRVEVDESDDRMQKKIRNAQLQKVPFMLIAGDRDVEAGRGVASATATAHQDNGVPVDDAIARVVDAVRSAGSQV